MSKMYMFIFGMAKSLDLFNAIERPRPKFKYSSDNIADAAESLRNDWVNIGMDMERAIEKNGVV